eukprot:TRINITY_DN10179_c0_g1_i3.p1 TRINITY_DN10179_c0_g1~~TRINITY_DN10179_c0_g1_i3.p1  ORF type:complete len:315 (-),score=74.03 TRINITY_DN10179_c0_g1_i3:217-1161(-)
MIYIFFFLMIRRPPRSTLSSSSAASDVYKRQVSTQSTGLVGCEMSAGGYLKPRRYQPIPDAQTSKVTFNWPATQTSKSDKKEPGYWQKVIEKQERDRSRHVDHTVSNAVQRLAKFRQGYYALFYRSGIHSLGSDVADGIDQTFLAQTMQLSDSEEQGAIIRDTNELRTGKNSLKIASVEQPVDPTYLKSRCKTLTEENERLQKELKALQVVRDSQEYTPAPVVEPPRAEQAAPSVDSLMEAFDHVDEDGTGFAPRLDLRRQIDQLIEKDPELQELSDLIRAMDVMIIEREGFEQTVKDWLGGRAGLAESSIGFD